MLQQWLRRFLDIAAPLTHKKRPRKPVGMVENAVCEFRFNPAGDSDLMSAAVPI